MRPPNGGSCANPKRSAVLDHHDGCVGYIDQTSITVVETTRIRSACHEIRRIHTFFCSASSRPCRIQHEGWGKIFSATEGALLCGFQFALFVLRDHRNNDVGIWPVAICCGRSPTLQARDSRQGSGDNRSASRRKFGEAPRRQVTVESKRKRARDGRAVITRHVGLGVGTPSLCGVEAPPSCPTSPRQDGAEPRNTRASSPFLISFSRFITTEAMLLSTDTRPRFSKLDSI